MISRSFADVACRPLGIQLLRFLRALQTSAESPPSGCPIVLAPVVASELLPRLLEAFRFESVSAGRSFISNRMGEHIAGERLHIVDDASRNGGPCSRAFDERGIPPRPVQLIREGLTSELYQGVDSARAHDARPSGHERSSGDLWPGNLIVRPGNRSRNMVFPDLGTFALVEGLARPGTIDIETGNIRLPLHVFRASAGGAEGYVGEKTLNCNVVELLGAVTHLLSDHIREGFVDTPSWVLQGLSLS